MTTVALKKIIVASAKMTQKLVVGGNATGTAPVSEVLEGSTFSNMYAVDLVGTMPNIGAQNITPSAAEQTISEGYHDGTGKVAGDADLVAGNIKKDVQIFGVTGTLESGGTAATGNATVSQVLSGATFSNAISIDLTGTMPNIGAQNITPSASNQSISAGYHNGSGVVAGDADLTAGNIKKDVAIFGVTGTYEGDTSAIKAALDAANEETSATVDAAIDLVESNYAAIKAAIVNKGIDMTGVKPSGYDDKIAAIPAAKENFAPVPVSGQTGTDATGLIAYPSPRFVDNSDGTITDKLTGLMWAKNLNLASGDYGRYATWAEAKSTCEGKSIGGYNDWRLPNVKEMDSLMDWSNYPLDTYLTTSGFANAGAHDLWLNTVAQNDTSYAFYIASQNGVRTVNLKTAQKGYVPVRGPIAP